MSMWPRCRPSNKKPTSIFMRRLASKTNSFRSRWPSSTCRTMRSTLKSAGRTWPKSWLFTRNWFRSSPLARAAIQRADDAENLQLISESCRSSNFDDQHLIDTVATLISMEYTKDRKFLKRVIIYLLNPREGKSV